MALHAEISAALAMPVYFCDKASPWQRPSNENTNGLLRQYFPKGSDLRAHGPDDLAALERLGLGLIDVVVVNLYPFSRAAANPETPFDALVEQIDIGGPSLVRAAAKNFRGVLVVVDPADYPRIVEALDSGSPSLALRFDLARKAIAHTAAYDSAITSTLATVRLDGDRFERRRGVPVERLAERIRGGRSAHDAEDASGEREHDGLDEELHQDVPLARA